MKYWLTILFLFLGTEVEAVNFSEVAWMGGSTSANHEWIELYNDGPVTSVTGWTINDGMNLSIELTGEIKAGEYVVLERSSEESASSPAFLIYTGALVNTGATLVIKDASGQIIDQIAGGENWQNIGGDNVTKETAQYSSKGWVTDVATPGQANGQGRVATTTASSSNTSSSNTSSSNSSGTKFSAATVPALPKEPSLKFSVEHQAVAYVGQPVKFLAKPSPGTLSKDLRQYYWNFGDTHATSGLAVFHTFMHPGTYVITTYVKKGLLEELVRSEISVVWVDISVSFGNDGVVYIHNDAPYDIDVSGYVVEATKRAKFPPRSIIKTGGTVTLEAGDLGSWVGGVTVKDNKGEVVVRKYINEGNTEVEKTEVKTVTFKSTSDTPVVPETDLIPLLTPGEELDTMETIYIEAEDKKIIEPLDRRSYGLVLVGGLLLLLLVYSRRQTMTALNKNSEV